MRACVRSCMFGEGRRVAMFRLVTVPFKGESWVILFHIRMHVSDRNELTAEVTAVNLQPTIHHFTLYT